jgi:hypothetical protein
MIVRVDKYGRVVVELGKAENSLIDSLREAARGCRVEE